MTLYDKIKNDQVVFRKMRVHPVEANVLGTLLGELDNKALLVNGAKTVNEPDVIATIKKLLKGIDEMIKLAPSDQLITERRTLDAYLPKQLTATELHEILQSQDCPKLSDFMSYLKAYHVGQYDGKLAADTFKLAMQTD